MLVVIGGATGTGKSDAAIRTAKAFASTGRSAEIINADALQLYRGMDIGTAKVPVAERAGIEHHMLDVLAVTDEASVAAYQTKTRALIESLQSRDIVPILVGGTGLYIDAVIHRLEFPDTDETVRARLEDEAGHTGIGTLAARLRTVDPESAKRIGAGDARRIIRALEVHELTGRPFSEYTKWANQPWQPCAMAVLEEESDVLAGRLAARTEQMWASGLLDEVKALVDAGLEQGKTAKRAIGYAQALAQLRGQLSESEAIAQTVAETVRYAKRQRTWFGRYHDALHCDGAGFVASEWVRELL